MIDYIIASTQRSGSSYLCHLLRQTKALGRPGEIYGKEAAMENYAKKRSIDVSSLEDFTSCLKSDWSTPNNVFGVKVHFHQFEWLIRRAPLSIIMPEVKFIYIDRRDLVMQAISLLKARVTGGWSSQHMQSNNDVCFDYLEFKNSLSSLVEEKNNWNAFFASCQIPYLHIFYEDLENKPELQVKRVADFLGVEVDLGRLNPEAIAIQKQRDTLSERWRDLAISSSKKEFFENGSF